MLKIKVIKKEFTITDENPCDGELEYNYIDSYDEFMTIKEFIHYLQRNGDTWYAPSAYRPLGDRDCVDTEYQVNPYSNDWIELFLHCADKDNENRWIRYLSIADKLGFFM